MTDEHPPTAVPSRLRDEPYSVKLAYVMLALHEPAHQKALAGQMNSPVRTVRWALGRLEDLGEVHTRNDVAGDARKKWYERTRET